MSGLRGHRWPHLHSQRIDCDWLTVWLTHTTWLTVCSQISVNPSPVRCILLAVCLPFLPSIGCASHPILSYNMRSVVFPFCIVSFVVLRLAVYHLILSLLLLVCCFLSNVHKQFVNTVARLFTLGLFTVARLVNYGYGMMKQQRRGDSLSRQSISRERR